MFKNWFSQENLFFHIPRKVLPILFILIGCGGQSEEIGTLTQECKNSPLKCYDFVKVCKTEVVCNKYYSVDFCNVCKKFPQSCLNWYNHDCWKRFCEKYIEQTTCRKEYQEVKCQPPTNNKDAGLSDLSTGGNEDAPLGNGTDAPISKNDTSQRDRSTDGPEYREERDGGTLQGTDRGTQTSPDLVDLAILDSGNSGSNDAFSSLALAGGCNATSPIQEPPSSTSGLFYIAIMSFLSGFLFRALIGSKRINKKGDSSEI